MPSQTVRNDLKDMLDQAETLLSKGRLQEAVNIANHALRNYRRDPRVWSLFSKINLAQRNYDNAIENAKKVIELTPETSSPTCCWPGFMSAPVKTRNPYHKLKRRPRLTRNRHH